MHIESLQSDAGENLYFKLQNRKSVKDEAFFSRQGRQAELTRCIALE